MSLPFSWPMTQTGVPRNRAKPPTMAASSPNKRSPESGVKSLDQPGDEIGAMRALRVARDQRLLPGREIGIKIGERLFGADFKPRQILARRIVAIGDERAQFLDLGVEFGDRFFEIEIATHERPGGSERRGKLPYFEGLSQEDGSRPGAAQRSREKMLNATGLNRRDWRRFLPSPCGRSPRRSRARSAGRGCSSSAKPPRSARSYR